MMSTKGDESGQQHIASGCSMVGQFEMKERESRAVRLVGAAAATPSRAYDTIHNFRQYLSEFRFACDR
jgi:hypothetical protein